MSDLVLCGYLKVMTAIHVGKERVKEFFSDENGVSPIVATILILLFVVLLAVVFWEQISDFVSGLWSKITNADTEFNPDDLKPTPS